MKMQDIKELTRDELELKLVDTYEALYNLRFQHAMHQLDNPLLLREAKKDIARLKTVLHEVDLGIRQVEKQQG